MKIKTEILQCSTEGQGDIKDITDELQKFLSATELSEGQLTVTVIGSTAGISTIEFEPGLIKDMKEIYEHIAPKDKYYHHHETWGDDNGSSHIRATMQGPSLTVPILNGQLMLGTWQQIVLMEFDTRTRKRKIAVQVIGK